MGADEILLAVADGSEPGHDRDCALAMLSQARHRTPLDDIQVQHLLAIGRRAGHGSGYRQAIADLRDQAEHRSNSDEPPTAWAVYSAAADFLESRLTQEQP